MHHLSLSFLVIEAASMGDTVKLPRLLSRVHFKNGIYGSHCVQLMKGMNFDAMPTKAAALSWMLLNFLRVHRIPVHSWLMACQ